MQDKEFQEFRTTRVTGGGYKGIPNGLTQCKKLDIRYGIFLVIFENRPKYTPEYYIRNIRRRIFKNPQVFNTSLFI